MRSASKRLWMVLAAAMLATGCKGEPGTSDVVSNGDGTGRGSETIELEEMKMGAPCGDMDGLQAGSPWPMLFACPARRSRSAFSGPQQGVVKWTYWSYYPLGIPAIAADGTLYLGVGKKGLVAIGPDGEEKWTYSWPGAEDDYSISAVPTVTTDGTIVVGLEGDRFVALTPGGEEMWTFEADQMSQIPLILADGTILVGTHDSFTAFKPDGTQGWVFEVPQERLGEDMGVCGVPALGQDGTVYFQLCAEEAKVYALTPDGEFKWRAGQEEYEPASTFALGNDGSLLLSTYEGALQAYDEAGQLKWETESLGGPDFGMGWPPPAVGGDGTTYLSRDSLLVAVDATGKVLWQVEPDAKDNSDLGHPVVDGQGVVFVSSGSGFVYAVDKDGSLLSSVDLGGEGHAQLVIGTDWTLYSLWFGYSSGDRTHRLTALAPCLTGCKEEQCAFGACFDVCVSCATLECTPVCEGAECGPDGCGGSCGTCEAGAMCVLKQCKTQSEEQCGGRACEPFEECDALLDACVTKRAEIPAGTFWMGCKNLGFPPADPECDDSEYPYHEVVAESYGIDLVEVTAAQYASCIEAGACGKVVSEDCYEGKTNLGKPGKGNHPMNCVAWGQASDYCQWACPTCRLCTEAEWEKAARGGCELYDDCKQDSFLFPWGNMPDDGTLSNCMAKAEGTAPVGSYPLGMSRYGVFDMAGNVEEWVSDWYRVDYYCKGPDADEGGDWPYDSCEADDEPHPDACDNPKGPPKGSGRVVRGGRFGYIDSYCRNSLRSSDSPSAARDSLGFRCCEDL